MEPLSRFHVLLRRKLDEVMAARKNELSIGAAPDYAAYKELVGRISGLQDACNLAEEVESDLNKDG